MQPLTPPTMTAARIRTTITVEPHVLEMYQRMAKASRQSVSRTMGDWLADTADGAMAITLQAEKARKEPLQAMHNLQLYAAAMHEGATDLVAKAKAKREGGDGVESAARLRPPLHASPPSSNTGGNEIRKAHNKVTK